MPRIVKRYCAHISIWSKTNMIICLSTIGSFILAVIRTVFLIINNRCNIFAHQNSWKTSETLRCFSFSEAEFIPPNKYHKVFAEKWYLNMSLTALANCSHTAVKFDTYGYGYLHTNDTTIGKLSYVRDDMVLRVL